MVKKNLRKCFAILPAGPVMTLGVVLFTKAGWGTDPFTSFEIGLSFVLSISLGNAALLFEGLCFFIFLFLRRNYIHFGTAAFCFGAGPCLDFWTLLVENLFPELNFLGKIICFLLGSVFIVISLAYYVQFHFGYQSLDMLSMLTAELCHKTYGFGLTVVYLVLTLLALIMGVKPGIGTLLSAVLFGKLVNIAMPAVKSLTKWI